MDRAQGLSRIIWLALVVLLLPISCGPVAVAPPDTPVSHAPTRTTATPTALSTPDSAQDALSLAFAEMAKSGSYHFDMDMQMIMAPSASPISAYFRFSGDCQSPNRLRGILTEELNGHTEKLQVIVIGPTWYATNPQTGAWEIPESSSFLWPVTFFSMLTTVDPAQVTDWVRVGEERLEGEPVHHFRGTADAEQGIWVEYWVGKEDNLMKKALMETAELSGWAEATFQVTTTVAFSNFGKPVAIEAPQLDQPELGLFVPPQPTPVPPVLEAMRNLPSGWTTYTTADGLIGNGVFTILVAPDGALWFGTNKGVSRFDGEKWTSYTTTDGLSGNCVTAIAIDPGRGLWFGTEVGLSRFDGERWISYTEADDILVPPLVSAIAIASDGSVWVGSADTSGRGVHRFDGERWSTFTREIGLAHNEVMSIAVALDGALWFGTRRGVSRFDGEEWTTFLGGETVERIAAAPDGSMWFGSGIGASRFDGIDWKTYTPADGLADTRVGAIAASPEGVLWFATYDYDPIPKPGVSRFDGETWTTFTTADGLVFDYVTSIVVAPDGSVWFGTVKGVSRYFPAD